MDLKSPEGGGKKCEKEWQREDEKMRLFVTVLGQQCGPGSKWGNDT
jgi:hypothetical protein